MGPAPVYRACLQRLYCSHVKALLCLLGQEPYLHTFLPGCLPQLAAGWQTAYTTTGQIQHLQHTSDSAILCSWPNSVASTHYLSALPALAIPAVQPSSSMSANGLEAPQYADGDTCASGQMMQLMCGENSSCQIFTMGSAR